MDQTKKETEPANEGGEPQSSKAGWGEIQQKDLTPEQIEDMKRMRFLMMARQQLSNPRLSYMQRKQI
jgi:hypothetical protein